MRGKHKQGTLYETKFVNTKSLRILRTDRRTEDRHGVTQRRPHSNYYVEGLIRNQLNHNQQGSSLINILGRTRFNLLIILYKILKG